MRWIEETTGKEIELQPLPRYDYKAINEQVDRSIAEYKAKYWKAPVIN